MCSLAFPIYRTFTRNIALTANIFNMLHTFFVSSPLDQFEVTKLISLDAPLLGSNLTLTNLGLYSVLVVIVFLGLHFLSVNSSRIVPSR